MKKRKMNLINKFKEREIWSIILFISSIIIFLSIITFDIEHPLGINDDFPISNLLGKVGVFISYYLVTFTIGYFSIIIPLTMLVMSYAIFFRKSFYFYLNKCVLSVLLFLQITILFARIANLYFPEFEYFSGYLGILISSYINTIFGELFFWLFVPISIVMLICIFFEISLYDLLILSLGHVKNIYKKIKKLFHVIKRYIIQFSKSILKWYMNRKLKVEVDKSGNIKNEEGIIQDFEPSIIPHDKQKTNEVPTNSENLDRDIHSIRNDSEDLEPIEENPSLLSKEITIEDEVEVEQGNLDEHESRKSRYKNYKLPVTQYLKDPVEISNSIDEDSLRLKAQELIHALETFGVKSNVKKISPGPVITLFEIEPDEGVRVNKFTNLSDDLARVMAAQRIRVIAPIPGTKSVGIELPNENPSIVYLKTIINSEQYINSNSKLTIGLGKTITGDAYIFDLAKMPHLLVAGATGAGKSVCINTIIISILYKAKPDEVKFIMVDPKKLELATYKSLVGYHLITAPNLDEYVMTTAENAVGILNSAITEMERRFQVFSDARVRNISEYHDRCKKGEDLEDVPYIVVLIDELADLMMTSGRAVEDPITRLAQKARAVGIHLVVATQRPSVDVITGLIKSNFPARISFQVSSKIDSRTILDQMGAEKLLGKGDMLFLLPGSASPVRLHNAFIQLDEIEQIMDHISSQPKPDEIHLPEIATISTDGQFSVDDNTNDELLYEAAQIVVDNQQASVSLLQRKLRVGYSRAGRLIDELESLGIISAHNGSKPRDVLVDNNYIDNIFNK